jgi:hypothetical protein
MHFLGLPPGYRRRFVIDNASLSLLALGGGRPLLETLNDTCHLATPGAERAS